MTPNDSTHVDELLDAFRTGELDDERTARVSAHLEGCARCRNELERLGEWAGTVERGFALRREASREREPDWAAQRAAIVARTSRGAEPAARGRGLWRWAPQVAVVALAALIVGIVARQNPREGASPAAREEPASAFERSAQVAPEAGAAGEDEADADRQAGSVDRTEAASERAARARQEPATPAPVPSELGKTREAEVAADQAANADAPAVERQEELADRAPPAEAPAALRRAGEAGLRFEREARAALAARDSAAARRALALWSDSLPGDERTDAARVALADSLGALLDGE